MLAVSGPDAQVERVQLLLDHGAQIDREPSPSSSSRPAVLSQALAGGNPWIVEALLAAGADVHYRDVNGYDALLDAVHGKDLIRDPNLINLLRLLISKGVALNGISSYQESALRVLSRVGRFDAVRVLLDAGADGSQLQWTPLIQAVALGTLSDVEVALQGPTSLEEKDWWSRTAWLVALQTGDLSKAQLLRERGADTNARGRCGKPPLFYPIGTHHRLMLRWLIEIGIDVEQTDAFGTTPLMQAVERDDPECVSILLEAGADVDRTQEGEITFGNCKPKCRTPLNQARSRGIVARLLEAGADPSELSYAGQRALLGYGREPDESLLDASTADFLRGRNPRFASLNPEAMHEPFWEGMIRAGITSRMARRIFAGPSPVGLGPVWCAQRFGQSITRLLDGRIVQVGGEHEDWSDPDFCIYNDVFVHDPDGTIRIFGYPESVFPPTDFHTATLVGTQIYLIGSLGYLGRRRHGETPVYRLDTDTFRIERVDVRGEAPGWISRHRASQSAPGEIQVQGGKIATASARGDALIPNDRTLILDLKELAWRETSEPG